MSDEESFVILGTSPTASMENVDDSLLATGSFMSKSSETAQKPSTKNDLECQLTNSAASSSTSQYTVVNNKSNEHLSESITNGNETSIKQDQSNTNSADKSKVNSLQNSASSESSVGGNLAASFILGEVDSTVLKCSLQSQFPSVLASTPPPSQIGVPADVVEECEKLKLAVLKTNHSLKFVYEQSAKWKKELEEKKQIEIAKLRNENLELRKDFEIKVEQLKINENLRANDQKELIRSLSEKQAQLKNMSAQIEKLERQQLSYEYVRRNCDQETLFEEDTASEYVSRLEYDRAVKGLERRMSELYAKNLDLEDMQKQYIDEINCLKVNLVAAEELQKKALSDISALTAKDVEKAEIFSRYEKEAKDLRDEVDILRKQLDIYSQDYKMEHEAKENLANEKDQLISDLRELQKRNQELIKEAQKNYEEHARQTMAPTGAFPKRRVLPDPSKLPQPSNPLGAPATTYSCPLCARVFKTLSVLQEHVNQCLDGI